MEIFWHTSTKDGAQLKMFNCKYYSSVTPPIVHAQVPPLNTGGTYACTIDLKLPIRNTSLGLPKSLITYLYTYIFRECLKAGANGIWASACQEGAGLGHACSTVTVMNLVRLGNTKVLNRYNVREFRDAAICVTKITTGKVIKAPGTCSQVALLYFHTTL